MLVLSRKMNEKIVINGNIVVTIVKIDRNQVRIGIEAPSHVPVFRVKKFLPHEGAGAPGRYAPDGRRLIRISSDFLLDNPIKML